MVDKNINKNIKYPTDILVSPNSSISSLTPKTYIPTKEEEKNKKKEYIKSWNKGINTSTLKFTNQLNTRAFTTQSIF